MLLELLSELKNYFEVEKVKGDFTLTSNSLLLNSTVNKPQVGQYIYIRSTLNRAVCKVIGINKDTLSLQCENNFQLVDDNVKQVSYLAIPQQIISLSTQIEEFETKNIMSPYTSESFGGWSGSRAQGRNGNITWQEAFSGKLKPFKKMFAYVDCEG